jgi:hypothetical protein
MFDSSERLSPTEIEITPEMIEAGKAVYRSWEESVDYNGGFVANSIDVETLVRHILLV